jgi:hypothetical protein
MTTCTRSAGTVRTRPGEVATAVRYKGSQVRILSSRHCRPDACRSDAANGGGIRSSGAAR